MSSIYIVVAGACGLALNELLGRKVAVKLLPAELAEKPSCVLRFRQEVQTLARMNPHPNVVTAMHASEHEGRLYLVMQFVPGPETEKHVEQHGPLAPDRVCDFLRQAAAALAYVHEHRLVHRDVTPRNFLIAPDGVLKLLDLGLARLADSDATSASAKHTQHGVVLGSLDYIASEQADDSSAADARSDLYSLGCTAYFWLLGRPPFAAHTKPLEKLHAHAKESPEPLALRRPDVPHSLIATVEKLMAKRPEDRYQSARELIEALDVPTVAPATLRDDVATAAAALPGTTPTPTTLPTVQPAAPVSPAPIGDAQRRSVFRFSPIHIGVAVAAALLALLLIHWFGRGETEDKPEAGSSPGSPLVDPKAPGPISASFEIEHYRPGKQPDDLEHLGRLGESLPRQHDRVTVVVRFDEPAYPYLLAVNAAGSTQMLHPSADSPQLWEPVTEFVRPVGADMFTLDDAGLVSFVLLAARQPLPELAGWLPQPDAAWAKTVVTRAWRHDGQRLEPATKQRDVGTARHGPQPLADFCSKLAASPGVAAVRALAFPVAEQQKEH